MLSFNRHADPTANVIGRSHAVKWSSRMVDGSGKGMVSLFHFLLPLGFIGWNVAWPLRDCALSGDLADTAKIAPAALAGMLSR